MANKYNGEYEIILDFRKINMRINMNVVASFQSETGHDFFHVAIRAMNALRKSAGLDPFDQSELLTSAVSMEDAAWLFYLAAKQCDSAITFEEIQEAVLHEGPLYRAEFEEKPAVEGYPVQFANLVMFAILGVMDEAKKN